MPRKWHPYRDRPAYVTTSYWNLESASLTGTGGEGKFVGGFIDAPLAVLGTWTLRDRGDERVGTGETIYSGFAAEFTPQLTSTRRQVRLPTAVAAREAGPPRARFPTPAPSAFGARSAVELLSKPQE